MWQVDNRTPFAVGGAWVRDRDGAEVWLVAVKCTFDIEPDGSTVIASEQLPVLRLPQFNSDPAKSSLKYDADLVLKKTTTDVIVAGHAYAPAGRPVAELDVGFRVGPVQKVLRVFGDRVWVTSELPEPEHFTKMPIVYERAFGGVDTESPAPERDWDWRNPVGTGFAVARSHLSGKRLPNIEYLDDLVRSRRDRPRPAGFGALASNWQPRAGFAGTYDDAWMRERQPLLPNDFDDRFFQCAPTDQQSPKFLTGGEPVVLSRLTPSGYLQSTLPRITLRFETRFYDRSREVHAGCNLHSVILEPDYPRLSLVWHTALPCHFKVQKLERTIVTIQSRLMPLSKSKNSKSTERN